MSAYGMKPEFTNYSGYKKWVKEWYDVYSALSDICKQRKRKVKAANSAQDFAALAKEKEQYNESRIMASKMMTLRNEATIRLQNITNMIKGIKDQAAKFPLEILDAKNIDLHFNKKHLEFPQVPMWTLKAKGESYYVNHLECRIPWSTRERPEHDSTKGMIRIKKGDILIDATGMAIIS